jgi:histidinol phosphatase-like enzyme (inositol monophosphatase family)
MLPAPQIEAFEALVLDLNKIAAEAILPYFRTPLDLQNKAGRGKAFDPVTLADKGAEAAIRQHLGRLYPEHGVIGEEYGEDRPENEFVWVLDPVDGTRAFVAGLPVWTTLIGLRYRGHPVLGSIGQGFLDEVYCGSRLGSKLISRGSTRALNTRPVKHLRDAIIATTDSDACFGSEERDAWLRLRSATRLARMGCDAYAYAMVAAGTLDVVVEAGLQIWDIEAAIPLIQGAGGAVTDWLGEPLAGRADQALIVGDIELTADICTLLRPAVR